MDTTTTPDRTPEQISLPGQAAVAPGPHDQTGMYLMHHAFRRDLAAFEAAVRSTPLHDARTWSALERRWALFVEVLHHHHTVEDTAFWPVMLAGAGEQDRRVLLAMEAEHELIDPALQACGQGFADLVAHPCADHRNALDVHVTSVRALLLEHLAHEETEALPLLQRTMSEEQYAVAEKAASDGYPLRLLPFLVPWVMDGVPEREGRAFLRRAGRAYVVLLTLLRPAYARRERRAFRHV